MIWVFYLILGLVISFKKEDLESNQVTIGVCVFERENDVCK